MAAFPTFESVLIKISGALGASKKLTSKSKNKFKNTEMNINNMFDTWKRLLDGIFDALELDKAEREDLLANIDACYRVHKSIEIQVFTYKASAQKVIWQYLARILIPTLARHSVFWQIDSRIDEGMPGGRFWYLPFLDPDSKPAKIELPLQQVLNWLLDLIEEPKSHIANNLESDLRIYEATGTILKNLNNWQSGKVTPEISSIKSTFPDDIAIKFKGCFEPSENSCAFEQSLAFVKSKHHTAHSLQYEIDISYLDLETILSGNCSQEQKIEFVHKICERYQQPSVKTIRQRLIVARAIQNGYEELIKFFTPNIDKFCTDLDENKVMQLIKLYEIIYNLTMKAHLECAKNAELIKNRKLQEQCENERFTQALPYYLRYDLLLSVVSEDYNTVDMVAPRLSEIFSELDKEDTLDNLIPTNKQSFEAIDRAHLNSEKKVDNFYTKVDYFNIKLQQNKTPLKVLKSTDDFRLVYKLAQNEYANQNIRHLAIERLKQLESSAHEQMKRLILELELTFSRIKFDKNTEHKTETLLELAWSNPEHKFWLPEIFRWNALHCIAQNKLNEAEKLLKKAIDECKNRSFGSLRGLLARDAFAIAISNQKLIPKNHETYFRDIVFFGGLGKENNPNIINIYDVSRQLHEYFWKRLYRNYPSYIPLYSEAQIEIEAFIKDFMTCMANNSSIEYILKKHNKLKNKQLKYPQSDSIILLLLKMSYGMLAQNARFNANVQFTNLIKQTTAIFSKQLKYVRQIIDHWSQIVDLSDFKQQSPLMIAVHNKDYETAEALLKSNANPNLQDISGRTALHSACASRTFECVELLIRYGIDERITTIEGATALHTAVRVGEIKIVELLISMFPHLLEAEEFDYRTPLILAEEIACDEDYYLALSEQFKVEQRQVVSHNQYKKLYQLLLSRQKTKT